MKKFITLVFFGLLLCFTIITKPFSQDLQNNSSKPGEEWKSGWLTTLETLHGMFERQQAQFRLMQSYQIDATEELILKDMDSLNVFVNDVNAHIDIANKFVCPNTAEGNNATETLRLKTAGLIEYFEQNRLQIHVNNNILQKKLKNETLNYKVSLIDDLKVIEYTPNVK